MYININGTQHSCSGFKAREGTRVVYIGVEDVSLPVDGEISLHADDSFLLNTYNTTDYARQIYENNTLVLTNEPEPEPQPDPEPQYDPIADLQELAIDHEYRITLMELGVM